MELDKLIQVFERLNQPFFWYTFATLFVLILLLALLRRRQPRNIVAYTTKSGQVMVARSAIVELVQTSCQQIPDISKPTVRIKVKGKKKHFEIRVKLESGGQLRSVEQTLQVHLRDALSQDLGIENLGRIDIVATGFKSTEIDSTLIAQEKEQLENPQDADKIEENSDSSEKVEESPKG